MCLDNIPRVGIVGGGQLARMTVSAAARLDLPLVVLADPADAAAPFVRHLVVGRPDEAGLRALAAACDVITVEHELLDLDALERLERDGFVVRPSAASLRIATDKVRQREVLGAVDVPLVPWTVAERVEDVAAFAAVHGWPVMCKRPRGGYDGRGVWEVSDTALAAEVLDAVGAPVLVEPRVRLDREIAVLVARRPGGQMVAYPPVETVQQDGTCREVLVPAELDPRQAARAETIAATAAEAVGAVGVLAVELFVCGSRLLLNELAARPHNSGHVTIEASATCQFENHLRAVADLPLGSTRTPTPAAMVNVIGAGSDPRTRLAAALEVADVAVHLYGKPFRPGRKLGHVTAVGPDRNAALDRARQAARILTFGSDDRGFPPTQGASP